MTMTNDQRIAFPFLDAITERHVIPIPPEAYDDIRRALMEAARYQREHAVPGDDLFEVRQNKARQYERINDALREAEGFVRDFNTAVYPS